LRQIKPVLMAAINVFDRRNTATPAEIASFKSTRFAC